MIEFIIEGVVVLVLGLLLVFKNKTFARKTKEFQNRTTEATYSRMYRKFGIFFIIMGILLILLYII